MTIVKWSKSGKQMQIVLAEDLPAGTVLGIASSILPSIQNKQRPFGVMTIMAHRTDPDRWPKSSVYVDGENISYEEALKRKIWNDDLAEDSLREMTLKKKEVKHAFGDKQVEW